MMRLVNFTYTPGNITLHNILIDYGSPDYTKILAYRAFEMMLVL